MERAGIRMSMQCAHGCKADKHCEEKRCKDERYEKRHSKVWTYVTKISEKRSAGRSITERSI